MKKKNAKMFLAAMLSVAMLAGCSGGGGGTTPATESKAADGTTTSQGETAAPTGETAKLTFFYPWTSATVQSASDNEAWQEAARIANVEIEFKSPPAGQEAESFNLMLASGEYPDLIKDQIDIGAGYKGGGLKAIEDGIYLKLNDYLDTQLPNYKAALALSNAISKQAKEDDGTIWSFKMIQPAEEPSWAGPAIRKDFLDQVNLGMPETIDDWYTALKAFKEQLNVEAPMLLNLKDRMQNSGAFMGAFDGAFTDFINKDGVVVYGPIQSGYKEWLTLMNQWYQEGLIDQNFATRDSKSEEAYISNGKTGSSAVLYYGEFPQYIIAGKDGDPNYDLQAAPYPVANKGDKVEDLQIGNKNWEVRGQDIAICAQSKNIDGALRLMDYWYSDEGFMLGNYGQEGTSYNWVDGPTEFKNGAPFFPPGLADRIKTQRPEYSDAILNNPDGIPFSQLWASFKLGNDAYLRNPLCYINDDVVVKAMEEWSRPGKSYNMPPLSKTEQESNKESEIMTPLKTYKDEMTFKFIIGDEPMSNFDSYVEKIKAMGIDEITQIKQAQIDRYNSR